MITYALGLFLLAVLSAIVAVKDVASTVLMATLGFGFPIIFAPTGLIYWIALYPIALLRQRQLLLGIGLAALLAALAATVPALVAQRRLNAAALSLLAKDHRTGGPIAPSSLEIWTVDGDDLVSSRREMCAEQCKSLLLSGRVAWVRMVVSKGDKGGTTSRVFRRVPYHCVEDGVRSCVEEMRGVTDAASVTIEVRPEAGSSARAAPSSFWPPLVVERRGHTFIARLADGTELLRAGRLTARIPRLPTLLGPRFQGIHSEGIEFVGQDFEVGPATLRAVLDRLAAPSAPRQR